MTPLLRRILLSCLAIAVLAQGCSAATVQAASPVGVPSVVFPALCTAIIEEERLYSSFVEEDGFERSLFVEEDGAAFSMTTVVLNETRAVFNTFALRVLHKAGELTPAESEQDLARDLALEAHFLPARIELPEEGGPCRWRLADRPAREYFGTEVRLLELSNVVEDPFAPVGSPRYGLFARESIAGLWAASWYWVALKQVGELWDVATVSRLEIDEF